MVEGVCELCGKISQLSDLEIHHIVPIEVTEPAGMPGSATAILCPNCHHEVHDWYARNVSIMTYHAESKSFQHKSPADIAREYEGAYRVFAQYKKHQRDTS